VCDAWPAAIPSADTATTRFREPLMDRRLLLAIALMVLVVFVPSLLWPPKRPPAPPPSLDTLGVVDTGASAGPTVEVPPTLSPAPAEPPIARRGEVRAGDSLPERLVVVESPLYRYEFSTLGGRLVRATLLGYRSFAPADSGPAQMVPPDSRFLALGYVVGTDTVQLGDYSFVPDADTVRVGPDGSTLRLRGRVGTRDVELQYRFAPDTYRFEVQGEVVGGLEGVLTVGLGPRLRSIDADTVTDIRSYGVVTKARRTERLNFRSLDPGERRELAGPFEWVAIKSKYFVQAVLAIEEGSPQFGGAVAVGGPKPGRFETDVDVTASLPVADGRFRLSVFIGPQDNRRLKRVGHDFDDVNPYGWIMRPIIRPVVDYAILPVLFWMHQQLHIAYGWVLILFGILVRLLLWPLNQKAMRSSTAMQAIQPELKDIQERHKNEPQRLQQEMLKLYKEHGVNPLGGCLPMLIPMPVLFALFFVFANTIEFRGVSFLWLPDLARADPFYIIPIVMGASMFLLSWIGQRNMPPNPQTKMMMYIMPGMFTFLFLNFSSGLNLYYAVSNIASLPQQWMISRERARRLAARGKG
jgi:YidC/Oxa1 family membrane protein insertase